MLEVIINGIAAVLIATAFATTALAAMRGRDMQDRSFQKVPARVRSRRPTSS